MEKGSINWYRTHGGAGSFGDALIELIAKADRPNRERLRLGFPAAVAAMEMESHDMAPPQGDAFAPFIKPVTVIIDHPDHGVDEHTYGGAALAPAIVLDLGRGFDITAPHEDDKPTAIEYIDGWIEDVDRLNLPPEHPALGAVAGVIDDVCDEFNIDRDEIMPASWLSEVVTA